MPKRAEQALAVLITVLAAVLHLLRARHAGALWRDEAGAGPAGAFPPPGPVCRTIAARAPCRGALAGRGGGRPAGGLPLPARGLRKLPARGVPPAVPGDPAHLHGGVRRLRPGVPPVRPGRRSRHPRGALAERARRRRPAAGPPPPRPPPTPPAPLLP